MDPKRPEAGDLFGFNRYAYAANNPVLNTDPDGQQTLPAAVYQIDWSKPENRQAAAEVAGLYTSFVPVIGDIQNIADAYREPTALNIATAGVGLIPEVGGAAARSLKTAMATGKEGEAAVRAAYDIGEKTKITIGKNDRIPDGINTDTQVLSEVKNVGYQGYTSQLRDYATIASSLNLEFHLYTRPNTTLSAPLKKLIDEDVITHRHIPNNEK